MVFLLKLVTDNGALSEELEDEIELEDFQLPSLSDEGAIEYIAGYITRKVHTSYISFSLRVRAIYFQFL